MGEWRSDLSFELIAGNLALDFTNTVHSYGEADPRDDLRGFPDFLGWSQQAGVLDESEVRRLLKQDSAVAARHFKRALDLREALYGVFSSIAQRGQAGPEMLECLNSYVRDAMGAASLQRRGERYELGWAKADPFDRALWEVTRAGADLLLSGKLDRVRQCGGESCSWLFLDTSRSGVRRWCDMRACGNRAKVRRFRQRDAG